MNETNNDAYPVLCGQEQCGRLFYVGCNRMLSVIVEGTHTEILATINPPKNCETEGCGDELARGRTSNPDVIRWLKESIPERVIEAS